MSHGKGFRFNDQKQGHLWVAELNNGTLYPGASLTSLFGSLNLPLQKVPTVMIANSGHEV